MTNLVTIAGMSRGGTNLLWNIVQSHPEVIDTYYETNEIFGGKTSISLVEKFIVELSALIRYPNHWSSKIAKNRLHRFAKYSFDNDVFNRQKYPQVLYEASEFERLTICTKLVSAWEVNAMRKILKRNDALKYIPLLDAAFDNLKMIFLVRNGLAVAEGWGRRGADIDTAAFWYRKYVLYYENYAKSNPGKALIFKFEDLLSDPFGSASKIFEFIGMPVNDLPQLRIAIKPTLRSNKDLKNVTEKDKVWVDRANFSKVVDSGINDLQIENFSKTKKNRFIEINSDILNRYGYI